VEGSLSAGGAFSICSHIESQVKIAAARRKRNNRELMPAFCPISSLFAHYLSDLIMASNP
jgi:hypothetical protein